MGEQAEKVRKHYDGRTPRRITTLVTDLDNTLFDWVDIWFRSFTAQVDAVARHTSVPVDTLLTEFKGVHERYGTSEFAFAVLELPSVRSSTADPSEVAELAWQALNTARKSAMHLFPGVSSTLRSVQRSGCTVVGYTESMPLYTKFRLVELGLDGLIDILYTPPGHGIPENLPHHYLRRWTEVADRLSTTEHRLTPPGELKPNPRLLSDIIADTGAQPEETVYVGDSQLKDVAMAQHAGIIDVWAKYGVAQHREQYELLRAVTHWTSDAVSAERGFELIDAPTYILEHSFSELLDLFLFGPG